MICSLGLKGSGTWSNKSGAELWQRASSTILGIDPEVKEEFAPFDELKGQCGLCVVREEGVESVKLESWGRQIMQGVGSHDKVFRLRFILKAMGSH